MSSKLFLGVLLLATVLPSVDAQGGNWCPSEVVAPLTNEGGPGTLNVVIENDHQPDDVRTCIYDSDGEKRLDRTYSVGRLESRSFMVKAPLDVYDVKFGADEPSMLTMVANLANCTSHAVTVTVRLTHVGTTRSWTGDGPHCESGAAPSTSPAPSPTSTQESQAPTPAPSDGIASDPTTIVSAEPQKAAGRFAWLGESRLPIGAPAPVAVLVLLAAGAAVVAWKLGGTLGFLSLYSRLAGPQVLDHATRSNIVALAGADPGINLNEVGVRLELPQGVLRHHVRVLLGAHVLREERVGRQRFLFTMAATDPSARQAAILLRKPTFAKFLQACRMRPGARLSDIAEATGMRLPNASKVATRLMDAGLLSRDVSQYPPRLMARDIPSRDA